MKKSSVIIIIILYLIISYRLIDLKFIHNQSYIDSYLNKANNIILGNTAPRGKILDTNGKVLVDNIATNNIIYRHLNDLNTKDEINIARSLEHIIFDVDLASIEEQKAYYILNNNTEYLLTDTEKENYKYRKLSSEEVYNLKMDRINSEILNYSDQDKRVIKIYYLMQVGYKEDNKIIKEDVSNEICAKITEENIIGVSCEINFKRQNNYDILKSIMGNVGKISLEDKEIYLNNGYDIADIVGISGLEKYYDQYLKGTKAKYSINKDNSLTLITQEIKGPDLILSLNIDIELKAEELLKEHLLLAQNMQNTDYYNHAYIIVSEPKSGDIIAMAGLRRNQDNTFSEISEDAMLSSYTVGSVVKGASHTVGYLNNLIDIGKKINDSCVKLYSVPAKCSFKRLGMIDDITALKMSSNYYQFITAIKSTGNTYHDNIKINVSESDFNKYRDVFKLYGLGDYTGIDYPKESIGIPGKTIAPDLLLNLAIGQYDTYTPLQLMAYINTIANSGTRLNLSFKKQDNKIVDQVNLDQKYMARIQEGFYEVVNNGTGRGYTNYSLNAVGKTGTSECFYGKNITTITQSYIMYAPRDDPKYSVVIVNPNVSYNNEKNNYIAPINRLIAKKMTDYLFLQ